MAALLNILHCEDAFDRTFLANHAKNVDGLADMVLAYSPERVSRVTGIEPDAIRRLAADIMSARQSVQAKNW